MSKYLAHSAKSEISAQSYVAHIENVRNNGCLFARNAESYGVNAQGQLETTTAISAELHDLGKLEDENQAVLRDECNSGKALPVNHVDAGTAALLKNGQIYAAIAVYSHHHGLPNIIDERSRITSSFLRDESISARKHTDENLQELLNRHESEMGKLNFPVSKNFSGDTPVFLRMVLSCLADADHGDTAAFYNGTADNVVPQLRAEERLKALDDYVNKLGGNDKRSELRREMYHACRNSDIADNFVLCDSPVGSGKTTAVMAHLLEQAQRRGLRRIFVVLPYTTIITQSVDVYRKALTLPGENPETVVAELHSRAEFKDDDIKHLTALWQAPIVVTTAVTFFETLASNQPKTLRRLHELPGSAIFVDEAHNALPLHLLPLAWRWMNVFADEWSCYWVLASGSPVKFWKLDRLRQFGIAQPPVANLVNSDLRAELLQYEKQRVNFKWTQEKLTRSELIDMVTSQPGPKLLIVNTIQTAAVLADDFDKKFGRQKVEHLSTALTPEDREKTINRIKQRLTDETDTDWTLVATSCVEAGVDFSFCTGFREISSVLSLIQASGRINRNGKNANAVMWSFTLCDDSMLTKNDSLDTSREVLSDYFKNEIEISPEICTKSLDDELAKNSACLDKINSLLEKENLWEFPDVVNEFVVIDSNTVTVIIDGKLAEKIKKHGQVSWQDLQRKSVNMRYDKIRKYHAAEIKPGLYQWTEQYDNFLGYMRGVVNLLGGSDPENFIL